jgi:hypothetical protein
MLALLLGAALGVAVTILAYVRGAAWLRGAEIPADVPLPLWLAAPLGALSAAAGAAAGWLAGWLTVLAGAPL